MTPKRVDANQPQIVAALRKAGCSIQYLHELGHGCPDLAVGFRGHNYFLEVKAEKGKLTPQQVWWHEEWKGQVARVDTVDEALAAVGVI